MAWDKTATHFQFTTHPVTNVDEKALWTADHFHNPEEHGVMFLDGTIVRASEVTAVDTGDNCVQCNTPTPENIEICQECLLNRAADIIQFQQAAGGS